MNDTADKGPAVLPPERKIIEQGTLRYKPFGVLDDGEPIKDISGKVVRSVIQTLEETVAAAGGDPDQAVEELCERLNDAIADPQGHVDPTMLRNEFANWSYEFYHYILEHSKVVSGDDRLIYNRGPKSIPNALVAIFRHVPIQQVYEVVPRLSRRFVTHSHLDVVRTSPTAALIRMTIDPRYEPVIGRYKLACYLNACESYKGTMAAVPLRMKGLPMAQVHDRKCLVRGDPHCEWEFTWENPAPMSRLGLGFGALAGGLAVALDATAWDFAGWSVVAAPVVVLLGVVFDQLRILRHLFHKRTAEITLQSKEFDEQYSELEQTQDRLQVLNADLERQVELRTKELKAANQRLEHLAITDELTDVYNRRYFFERVEAELKRAGRYGSALSLLMIDVDHFKRYNDEHGHLVGDRVLAALGGILKVGTRGVDAVARYGGEEFAVLLPETDLEGARQTADKLRETVEAATPTSDGSPLPPLTISVGAATANRGETSPEALIDAADRALYRAKNAGRNRVEVAAG